MIYLKVAGWEVMDSIHLFQDSSTSWAIFVNTVMIEALSSTDDEEVTKKLSDYQLLEKGSAPVSYAGN
jgi:hypothetical protein